MPLLLPNLDDRTWADLVEESTSLIPVYGPEWTDQNYSDPGITIVELLSAIAEMDIYQLNQISDDMRLKFLALVGVRPNPPHPAHAVLSLTLATGLPATTSPIIVPAGVEFAGVDPSGTTERFRTLRSLALAAGTLKALQFHDAAGYHDLTPLWQRRAVMLPFGSAPQPGAEFYLGFSDPWIPAQSATLFLTFADGHSTLLDRQRLRNELCEIEKHCHPIVDNPCQKPALKPASEASDDQYPSLKHYGVRTVWEYLNNTGGQAHWTALDPAKNEVSDDTRSFTLNGAVTFRLPGTVSPTSIGAVATPYYYVRCRFEAGRYDAPPSLKDVAFNAAVVEQAVPAWTSFDINPNPTIVYGPLGPPNPYDLTTVTLKLDEESRIVHLAFGLGKPGDPEFRILSFQPPPAGNLSIEAMFLGFGTGFPHQHETLANPPIKTSGFRLYTLENDAWYSWEIRQDFFASHRGDFHAVLDPTCGAVRFGDGEKGRVPPEGCEIFAAYFSTAAQAGNLEARTVNQLADSPHNRAQLYDPTAVPDGWTKLKAELASIENPLPASGGSAAQTIDQAAGRADQLVESSERAVTLADYMRLAVATPGTRIARVTAIANMHPDFPCYKAPGMITVIVVPYLPAGRPVPTPGMLHAVTAHLRPRRVIGTRVEVAAPTYLEVQVQATVQSVSGTNRANLQKAITQAINGFFDPLTGGPDGSGWPFGRNVYRSEVMKIINQVSGVDYVATLALVANCGQPQCGNVCLGPTWLVGAGAHQITVL